MGNVLLVMGHRNTDRGNEEELRRTPFVVEAAERELRRAGHTVHVLQREDGIDQDPDFTNAGLAFVANRCTELIRQHGIQVMIDAHFQGSPNPTTGLFCIFPDFPPIEPKAMNPRDVAFAQKLAEEASRQTGIRMLPLSEPGFLGGMSERQSGVGQQGFRLGMFNLTMPVREQCVRVIMEHGDMVADRAVIDAPGYFDRVARAYVRAVDAFWPVVPADPRFFEFREPTLFTAQAGAFGRRHASTDSEIVRRYEEGESIRCVGYYEAQEVAGDNRWLRSAGPGAPRIHRSGVLEEIPQGTPAPAAAGRRPTEAERARAEAERRGPAAAAAQIEDTAALGCDMLRTAEEAAVTSR